MTETSTHERAAWKGYSLQAVEHPNENDSFEVNTPDGRVVPLDPRFTRDNPAPGVDFLRGFAATYEASANASTIDFNDDHGIIEVFAAHLELSLKTMRPDQAFEAAQHATRHYLVSYEFVEAGYKGSAEAQYRMVPKRAESEKRGGMRG